MDFRHITTIKVQFRDVDSLGHVNNAVYLSYLETGRVEFCEQAFGPEGFERFPFILAEVRVKFLAPAFMSELIELWMRVSDVGRKSFRFEYHLRANEDERMICEAESVQVMYDYRAGKTTPVPSEWRRIVESL